MPRSSGWPASCRRCSTTSSGSASSTSTECHPTSHVVDVSGVLRARRAEPCLPRDVVLAAAPEPVDGGFGVPSPGAAATVSELIELTAAEAAAKVRAREIDRAELFDAYRERAAADELNAFTWVADAAPNPAARRGRRRSAASRSRSRICSAPTGSRARRARESSRATGRRTPRPSSPS